MVGSGVNLLVCPKELEMTVVFTMFIITDMIQVLSITAEINLQCLLLFFFLDHGNIDQTALLL